MEYIRQAVLHIRRDRDSEVRELLKTTTEFVSGGLQLASAVWSKDVAGVLSAIKGLKKTASDFVASQPKPW